MNTWVRNRRLDQISSRMPKNLTSQRCRIIQWTVQGQLKSCVCGGRTTLDSHFISYSKINFRWTRELNIKTKTMRNPEHINNYTLSWENHLNIVEEITKRKIGGFEYIKRVFKMTDNTEGQG